MNIIVTMTIIIDTINITAVQYTTKSNTNSLFKSLIIQKNIYIKVLISEQGYSTPQTDSHFPCNRLVMNSNDHHSFVPKDNTLL